MAAADLLGQSGRADRVGSTARHLPMVTVVPLPGQEERNVDHLLERGVAIGANTLPVAARKIPALIRARARLARPRAAADIAADGLALLSGQRA